ncbi:MAG: thiol reductant ABC exporter subunit CydC, partial [Trebonia sp.]
MIRVPGSPGKTPTRPPGLASLLAPGDGERGRGLIAVGIGTIGQLAGIGLLATSAWLITTASLRPPVLTLTVAIAAVRFFALLRGAARYGERLAGHDLALRVLARLRVWAFARIEPLVPARWPGTRRGDLLSRFVADIDGVQDLYVRLALPLTVTTVTAAVTVTTAGLLDPACGLVLGVGLGLGAVLGPAASAVLGSRGAGNLAVQRGQRDALVVEMLHGAAELAVFGGVPAFLARLAGTERGIARQSRRASIAAGLGAGVGVALGGLLAAAMILVSLPALEAGRITGAAVAVLGFLGLACAESVSGLSESFARAGDALGGARRVLALATEASPAAQAPTGSGLSPAPAPSRTGASQLLRGGTSGPAGPRIALDDVVVS